MHHETTTVEPCSELERAIQADPFWYLTDLMQAVDVHVELRIASNCAWSCLLTYVEGGFPGLPDHGQTLFATGGEAPANVLANVLIDLTRWLGDLAALAYVEEEDEPEGFCSAECRDVHEQ